MLNSSQPPKIVTPFANSAGASYIRTVPVASQIGITNGAASFTDGFPPDCFIPSGAGGYPPDGRDVNYLLNIISAWTRWQNAGGSIIYDATFSTSIGGYPNGAVLVMANGGGFWQSTVDNNTSNPDTGGANWSIIALSESASDLRYAALLGSSAHTFLVAPATAPGHAVNLNQFNGYLGISTPTTLTTAQSGARCTVAAATANYNITVPSPAAGLFYEFEGTNAAFSVGLTFTGTLFLPDGTTVTAGTYTAINLANVGSNVHLWSDGASWYLQSYGLATLQDVTASRALSTTYTNSTPRKICVMVSANTSTGAWGFTGILNGVPTVFSYVAAAGSQMSITMDIPPGATYSVTGSTGTPTISKWIEVR